MLGTLTTKPSIIITNCCTELHDTFSNWASPTSDQWEDKNKYIQKRFQTHLTFMHLQGPPLIFPKGLRWGTATWTGGTPRRTAGKATQAWPECVTTWRTRSCGGWWQTARSGSVSGGIPGCGPMGVNLHSYPGSRTSPSLTGSLIAAHSASPATLLE